MTKKPFVVAITGGIGSGKSTVADIFHNHGIDIIDADLITRKLITNNVDINMQLKKRFGPEILDENQQIDRAKVRKIVFNNAIEKHWLERLLHPLVEQELEKQLTQSSTPYCIVVIPLLAEKGRYPFIDRVLVIDSPEPLQIARATKRDNSSAELIRQMMMTQASRNARLEIADDVIVNDGDLKHLEEEVGKLHKYYLSNAS